MSSTVQAFSEMLDKPSSEGRELFVLYHLILGLC